MTGNQPAAVKYGIVSSEQWQELVEAQQTGDLQNFLEKAVVMCRDNVPLFASIFLGYQVVPHMVPLAMAVRNNINNLILFPRSHGKSHLLAIAWPIHHICYSTIEGSGYEGISILLLQESTTSVKSSIMAIQSALEPPETDWAPKRGEVRKDLIQSAFGNIRSRARKWNEDTIALAGKTASREYTLYGRGANAAITGQHPKLLIADDIVTKNNAKTQHLRDEMWDWWGKTVLGLMDPGSKSIIIGTPYYSDDLYHRLMKTEKYNVLRRPALSRPIEKEDFDPVFDEDGNTRLRVELTEKADDLKALWPCPLGHGECPMTDEHFDEYGIHRPVQWLIHEKYLEDPIGFASQYMLQVLGTETSRIKPGMLRFYTHDESEVGQPTVHNEYPMERWPHPSDVVSIVHAWDHAIGKRSANDNTAFARAIRTKKNKIFFEVRAGKWDFSEAIERMESWYETDPLGKPQALVTEAIGFQQAYSESLLEKSKKILPIHPVKKTSDKDTFLMESQILTAMSNGQVYFDIKDKETINEMLAFTPDGSGGYKDDRVDACALAFHVIRDAVKRPAKVYRMQKRRGRRKGYSKYRRNRGNRRTLG